MTDKQSPESRGTEVAKVAQVAKEAVMTLSDECGSLAIHQRPSRIVNAEKRCWEAIDALALLATQRSTEPAVRGDARLLIKECLDALATELTAWDLDPPLAHVKKAHDRCIEWLAQTPEGKDEP